MQVHVIDTGQVNSDVDREECYLELIVRWQQTCMLWWTFSMLCPSRPMPHFIENNLLKAMHFPLLGSTYVRISILPLSSSAV